MNMNQTLKKAIIITVSVLLSVLVAVAAVFLVLKLMSATSEHLSVNSDNSSSTVPVISEPSSETVTDNGIGLVMVSPSKKTINTTEPVFTFSGTSDPLQPLTVNGNEVTRAADGIFSFEVNLKVGKNIFKFEHKGETQSYTINYRYVIIESYAPYAKQVFSSGSTFSVSVYARNGSQVTASFNGAVINLTPQETELTDTSVFINYTGSFTLPSDNYSDLNLGKITFKGTHSGKSETFYSGVITCKKPDFVVDYNPNATPLGGRYINVGSGKITEIIAHEAETFDAYSTNDWSKSTNNYLPKGTVDYSAQNYVYYISNGVKKEYSVLRCGRQVYTKKNDIPVADDVPVVKEYAGTLPEFNQVGISSFENNGSHTVLTLDCSWNAPFYFDILPQSYSDGNREYNITNPTYNYIDITFCYANELVNLINAVPPQEDPPVQSTPDSSTDSSTDSSDESSSGNDDSGNNSDESSSNNSSTDSSSSEILLVNDIEAAMRNSSAELEIPTSNPLFSSAKIIKNQSDYTLRLYLKKQGGFYGWTCYYDESYKSADGKSRLCFEFLNPAQTKIANNKYGIDLSGVKILLDVGHGGKDPGAGSKFDKTDSEASRNLILANIVKAELESIGATVYMNRTDNTTSSTDHKLQLIKRLKPDLCLAIHHNSATTSKAQGFDTRYYTPFSKKAAEFIHNQTYNTGIYGDSIYNKFGWHYYFMARNTTCPVILTENGYMSNSKDYNGIKDYNTNVIKANAFVRGIAEYFTSIRF